MADASPAGHADQPAQPATGWADFGNTLSAQAPVVDVIRAVNEVVASGVPMIVTDAGRSVAMIVPIEPDHLAVPE